MSDDRVRFKKFYQSKEWRNLRLMKLANDPCCECCLSGCSCYYSNPEHKQLVTPAYAVDHRVPLGLDWSKSLQYENLGSLCSRCHQVKTNTTDHYLKREQRINLIMSLLSAF